MEFYKKKLGTEYNPDVLVCGLGSAGIAAAVAAARAGAKTMAIEKCAFAGGNITNASVIGISSAFNHFTGEFIVGGIALDLIRETGYKRNFDNFTTKRIKDVMAELDGAPICEPLTDENFFVYDDILKRKVPSPKTTPLVYDVEEFKCIADRMLLEAGVKVLYHTSVADTITRNGHIEQIIIANKDGIGNIRPKIIIDCTGDADVAAWSGAPFEQKDQVQPGTMLYTLANLKISDINDVRKMRAHCYNALTEAVKQGEIDIFCGPAIGVLHPGVANFNNTRIVYDSTCAEDVTRGEMKARKDINLFVGIYKREIEAFKDAYILAAGPQLGPRESRRIIGEYVLTLEDILEKKSFSDAIGLGGGFVDFHKPDASGFNEIKLNKPHGIPYRTLLPKKIDNLLVAGRCHSVTQQGAAVTRMAVTAMLMGEAAGSAAALSLMKKCSPNNLEISTLQDHLLRNGAVLE